MNTSDICGTCTMCCKLLGIGDELRGEPFKKPAGVWCQHCAIGKGCKVYEERPRTCREFKCLYLEAVVRGEIVDQPELRPDRCGVVLSPTIDEDTGESDDDRLCVSVDKNKPDAWRRGAIGEFLMGAVRRGMELSINDGPSRIKRSCAAASRSAPAS